MAERVLHVINGEFYAGGERVQDLLALRLPELGYEVGFVCLKNGIFSDKRKAKDAALHCIPMRSKLDVGLAFRLADLARRGGYRLIHTHTRRAALVGQIASILVGIPMIHHLHSPSDQDTDEGWRNVRNSMVEKFSLLRARMLIPVSKSLERYLLDRGYASQRIRAVLNGVPVQDKVRKIHIPGGTLVIGSVALFRPRKGIEVLLQAIAQLRQAGHDVRLHAVGPFETTEYQESVLHLVSELGLEEYIHWTGFTGNVAAEFTNMHVFVLPSLFGEGMPMVVLEAMAAGLPVVSTQVEGIPEVIRDGQDGLLVAPGGVDELAGALLKFVLGDVNIDLMGDSGWQRQRDEFSDLAMAKGVAAIYRKVLEP